MFQVGPSYKTIIDRIRWRMKVFLKNTRGGGLASLTLSSINIKRYISFINLKKSKILDHLHVFAVCIQPKTQVNEQHLPWESELFHSTKERASKMLVFWKTHGRIETSTELSCSFKGYSLSFFWAIIPKMYCNCRFKAAIMTANHDSRARCSI